jgi:hypothetical protein
LGCGLAIVTALVVGVVLMIRTALSEFGGWGPQPGTATVHVPITGSAAVLSDGVTIVYSDPSGLCRMHDLSATETAGRVALSLTESQRLDDLGCAGFASGPAQAGQGSPNGFEATTNVTLSSPLGGRPLVDAVTGRAIPCFDQRGALLLPQVAGWVTPGYGPGNYSTDVPYFGGPGAAILAETRLGLDPGAYQVSGALLLIVQVAGGGWHPPDGTVTTRVLVRGRPGLAAPGIIVWSEGGHTIAVIGQGPASASPGAQSRPPLPLASLEAIASDLTGAG